MRRAIPIAVVSLLLLASGCAGLKQDLREEFDYYKAKFQAEALVLKEHLIATGRTMVADVSERARELVPEIAEAGLRKLADAAPEIARNLMSGAGEEAREQIIELGKAVRDQIKAGGVDLLETATSSLDRYAQAKIDQLSAIIDPETLRRWQEAPNLTDFKTILAQALAEQAAAKAEGREPTVGISETVMYLLLSLIGGGQVVNTISTRSLKKKEIEVLSKTNGSG